MNSISEEKSQTALGTGRAGVEQKQVSPRGVDTTTGNGETLGSARASARGGPEVEIETFRSTMDTARVHTALAALSAERQALMSKLAYIDSALEAEGKKKASLVGRKK